ncbi:MAG: ribonuclease catalytic domain-containing protein, partial [Polyangia bacterium]
MNTMRDELQGIAHRAMLERGLLPEFSREALAEASALSREVASPDAKTPAGVRDLRQLLWCSIDNDDSRDLDQLSVAEASTGGRTKIMVAIADVDARVRLNSALDEHAATNTTSVYTAARVFPMLPEVLSTGLTSLNEGQDRLAMVVEMMVDGAGALTAPAVYRALVRNHAKLAYNAVAAWLEGPPDTETPPKIAAVIGLADNLRLQDGVAQALRERRHQQGALAMETLEPRAVFDGDAITDIRLDQKNRAKELIEDFMIASNVTTALFLQSKGFPSLRRVLRSPERWARIVALAETHGVQLPGQPDAAALEKFLEERRRQDPVRFPDLSLAVVKLLGRGEYTVEEPGQRPSQHFGLAVKDYTHSTAPNRRFPDLITQRLVKAALAGTPAPYGADQL